MKSVGYFIINIFQYLLWLLPLQKNKIIVFHFYGKDYGGNCKYVCEELIKIRPNVSIIWVLKGNTHIKQLPQNIKYVKCYSLQFFYHLCTSTVWISNCRMHRAMKKRHKQYYIQLWHGSTPLKRIEKDAINTLDENYIRSAIYDSKIADLFISNSRFCSDLFRKAFWYNGEIAEVGSPCADILYKKNDVLLEKIKTIIGLKDSTKLFLYAPTFRNGFGLEQYTLDVQKVSRDLEISTGEKWHGCVRLHPNLAMQGIKYPTSESGTDLTDYPDIYELLAVTDLLITDYSSTMFEAGFAQKPVILYITDMDAYKQERNVYFEPIDLPFPIAKNNVEMGNCILEWNQEKYCDAIRNLMSKLGVIEDGHASQKVAEIISSKLYG